LTAIFNEAVRLGKVKHNPATAAQRLGVGSVEATESENTEVRPEEVYNAEELNRLIQHAEAGFFKTLIFTVALTGIRHGEALALQWGDIDLTAGKITVRRTWPDKWREDEPIFYVPKSKNGVREIPIPGELAQALKRWKLSCAISKWDLVFPKKDGAPHDRKTILRSGLYPAIRRAEVKKLDMHALRHTFASLLLSQGTPITEVSSYLGHADPQITLRVYSQWIPRTKTDSISRLAG
jgi:integrase